MLLLVLGGTGGAHQTMKILQATSNLGMSQFADLQKIHTTIEKGELRAFAIVSSFQPKPSSSHTSVS